MSGRSEPLVEGGPRPQAQAGGHGARHGGGDRIVSSDGCILSLIFEFE
jgi:hypothetical protein